MQLKASPASSEVTFFSHLLLLAHMKTSVGKSAQAEMETSLLSFRYEYKSRQDEIFMPGLDSSKITAEGNIGKVL